MATLHPNYSLSTSSMEGDHIKICHWLTPLSWLYGLGVTLRDILYESGVLKSRSFDIPIISVGNITVGGTGKTPHTEYLIRLLSERYQVGVLSRGYKRKTKGYRLATSSTPMREIGDEPFQMKQKFPQIFMAVDRDRCEGIERLCCANIRPPVDVILLDDAFQHRSVKPGVNIVLMDYHRLVYFDKLLPAGRLREPVSSLRRADIVIVTKCPPQIKTMEERGITRSLDLQAWQKIYFTTFRYQALRHLASGREMPLERLRQNDSAVIRRPGIAPPRQMEYGMRMVCAFTALPFPDHHNFTRKDLAAVERIIQQAQSHQREVIVITTEKDATRLTPLLNANSGRKKPYRGALPDVLHVLPIEVQFLDNQAEDFNHNILSYVQEHSRNR
jgi:tetraacyldisaccharide 4'-kinase